MFPFALPILKKPGVHWTLLFGLLLALTGCSLPKADAQLDRRGGGQQPQGGPAAVNVAIAQTGTVEEELEYTGTTQPFREVSLRSRVNAQLLNLTVDVGDAVRQEQVLAQFDSDVQAANVAEARAEVAALEAEVADALVQISDARAQVNRAQAELQQAQSDFRRLQFLAQQGAVPAQEAEQAQTAIATAEAALQSAQEQVRSRQQQVVVARGRVDAQRAVVAQQQEQQSFTELVSPVTGYVLSRESESGNVVQPGDEVLRLGDFSQIKIAVQVSELELGNIRQGQTVQVRLDAFPEQQFSGRVSRISPAADPVARLVPIEVTIPNLNGQIASGLLARVAFMHRSNRPRVVVPETALQANQDRRGGQQPGNNAQSPSTSDRPPQNSAPEQLSGLRNLPRDIGTVFLVEGSGNEATVTARQVTLGRRGDGQVEVIDGLQAGDRYVARSSKALKNGDSVRLSILSK